MSKEEEPPKSAPQDMWKRISQGDLDVMLENHEKFLLGKRQGNRASFRFIDVSDLLFRRKNLSQADFSVCRAHRADLSGCKLEAISAFGADFLNAKLSHARLEKADLRGARMRMADLSYAILTDADMRDGSLMVVHDGDYIEAVPDNSKFSRADASGAIFDHAKLSNNFISQTDLSDTILKGTKFVNADLSDSVLSGAIIEGVDFSDADLSGADMEGAVIVKSYFRRTKLADTNFVGAILEDLEIYETNLDEARLLQLEESDQNGVWEMIKNHNTWMKSHGKDGARGDLSSYSLSGMNLSGLPVSLMNFKHSAMRKVSFDRSFLLSGDLSYCDLREASFVETDLRGAKFERANMQKAVLKKVQGGPLTINEPTTYTMPLDFTKAKLMEANLARGVFRKASFKGANLTEANLSRADFEGADFENANLTDAKLSDANFEGANMTNVIGLDDD